MQRSNNDFCITTKRDGSRSFGEHDDRWAPQRGRGNGRGRKSYSSQPHMKGRRGGGRGRGSHSYYHANGAPDSLDQEGDDMMGGDADQGALSRRHNPYGNRALSRQGRRNNQHNGGGGGKNNGRSSQGQDWSAARRLGLPVHGSGKTWFKVVIPLGKKVDKQALLDLIGTCVPRNFRPIQFTYQGEAVCFYIDDRDVADILRCRSKALNMPNSTTLKLVMIVNPSSPPFTPMTKESKAKLMEVMRAHYDSSVKVLDLTCLQDDQTLQQEGMFLPMTRQIVANSVSEIISKNIPELVGLNLSKNRLMSLSALHEMTTKAPNVTSLNLGSNQLNRIEELDKIKKWSLVEIILDKNPLCSRFSSKADYISAVRKRFPKIIRLDGNELPPAITFDLGANVVPASKGSYFVNSKVQDLVVRFLNEFYTIYDSDNRQALADAYHEGALHSLTMANNPSNDYKQPFMARYNADSCISIRMKSDDHKGRMMYKLLKKGRQEVVAYLCSLPKTTHDANSFVVDVNLVSSTLLSFVVVVSGLFKESDNKADKPPIRAFTRCFITVPANGGVLISNDMLCVTNATSEQQQAAFKSTGPTPSSSPVSSNPPALTSPVPSTSGAGAAASPEAVAGSLSPQQQLEIQQMVLSFSERSGMNYIFSFRCLEDNAWDYNKAAQIFVGLQAEGKIPPEAFVK